MEFLGDIDNPKQVRAFAVAHLPKNYKKMEAKEAEMGKKKSRSKMDKDAQKEALK